MMQTIPFTYVITFVQTGQRYYGCRYARHCTPASLWTTYFTSSKVIHKLIKQYGVAAFTVQVRKTFTATHNATEWERKVLQRLGAAKSPHWFNLSNGHKQYANAGARAGQPKTLDHANKLRSALRRGLQTQAKKHAVRKKQQRTQMQNQLKQCKQQILQMHFNNIISQYNGITTPLQRKFKYYIVSSNHQCTATNDLKQYCIDNNLNYSFLKSGSWGKYKCIVITKDIYYSNFSNKQMECINQARILYKQHITEKQKAYNATKVKIKTIAVPLNLPIPDAILIRFKNTTPTKQKIINFIRTYKNIPVYKALNEYNKLYG